MRRAYGIVGTLVVGSGLALSCSGPERGEYPTPIPVTPRSGICDMIQNTHRCARAIEANQLPGADGISRTARGLCFESPEAQCVPDDDDLAYSYLGTISRPPYHVLWAQYVEGNQVLLVHAATGKRVWVDAIPVVSPDGNRLAVASADLAVGYNFNRLTIFAASGDSLVVDWLVEPQDWGPSAAAWLSDSTIAVERIVFDSTGLGETIGDPILAIQQDQGWGLMPCMTENRYRPTPSPLRWTPLDGPASASQAAC